MTVEGQEIVDVRPMTDAELEEEGWHPHHKPVTLVLSDGSLIYASMDPEGNGAGCLFGMKDGDGFYVVSDDS